MVLVTSPIVVSVSFDFPQGCAGLKEVAIGATKLVLGAAKGAVSVSMAVVQGLASIIPAMLNSMALDMVRIARLLFCVVCFVMWLLLFSVAFFLFCVLFLV
jgi:hypothetical protein